MRPTGPLHIGNLHGALANWKAMQDDYDCFFFVADWHALTSDYENTKNLPLYTMEMIMDWLSVGLSPDRCTLFVQSHVKEHAELFLVLSMITPVPWLQRVPTYKEQLAQLADKDLSTFGFLGYPVLQAADIIMYKAYGVPVGEDQVPHVELAREIVRRFNFLFGEVFVEPQSILTETPRILGTDRRKMSKSYNNAIYLSDPPEAVSAKVSEMITDPQRKRRRDPGDPDVCNVFSFHKIYSDGETVVRVNAECRNAGIGCVECKRIMAEGLNAALEPIREKRRYYEAHRDDVARIIADGDARARAVAEDTMQQVRRAIRTAS
jgi:tryptophanyl-tRNA synthetase